MIVYKINVSGVVAFSAAKETEKFFIEHGGSRITKIEMPKNSDHDAWRLGDTYYTTDIANAKEWADRFRSAMSDAQQVILKTLNSLECWEDFNEMDESILPERSWLT